MKLHFDQSKAIMGPARLVECQLIEQRFVIGIRPIDINPVIICHYNKIQIFVLDGILWVFKITRCWTEVVYTLYIDVMNAETKNWTANLNFSFQW